MIVQKLTKTRRAAGLSLYDISKKTGIGYSVLYYIDRGRRDPQVSTALKIARALGCTVEDLFEL